MNGFKVRLVLSLSHATVWQATVLLGGEQVLDIPQRHDPGYQ